MMVMMMMKLVMMMVLVMELVMMMMMDNQDKEHGENADLCTVDGSGESWSCSQSRTSYCPHTGSSKHEEFLVLVQ